MASEPPITQAVVNQHSDRKSRYVWAVLAVGGVGMTLAPFRGVVNSTTVALVFLLAILFIATLLGSRPALLASLVAMLFFNFYFLPPFHKFTIADPQNWVALFAFFATAITAGQLSARARERAEEAVRGRLEIEGLYKQLREAFQQASHAEALRQSETLKSALLDAVTHDIRTPLTSIKASVTTLLDAGQNFTKERDGVPDALADGRGGLDREGTQELLDVINEEADRLNNYVESLIELARIEAGQMTLRRRWGVIDDIIAAALKRAEPLTRAHRLEVEIEKDLPAARVDSSAVAEVVYTLVDNATKFAPTQTLVRLTAKTKAHEMIEIAVEDQGPGIPHLLRARVFDKFFSAGQKITPGLVRPAGIGFGLAIARGIVGAHGGRIWVEDGSGGKGARVLFTVPVGDEEASVDLEGQASELKQIAYTAPAVHE